MMMISKLMMMMMMISKLMMMMMLFVITFLQSTLLVNHPQIGIGQVDDGFFLETTLAPSDEQGSTMFDQDLVLEKKRQIDEGTFFSDL